MTNRIARFLPNTQNRVPYPPKKLRVSPDEKPLTLYTDGSYINGSGGWAAVIYDGTKEVVRSGNQPAKDNMEMELKALLEGVKSIPPNKSARIYTDFLVGSSDYAIKETIKKQSQKSRNRMRRSPKAPLWVELWKIVHERKNLTFGWIKGHSGIPGNERADQVAKQEASELKSNGKRLNRLV